MPFTPLHMGPAIALKAVAQRRFSLMVFGWSQILMDLQPLYVMLTGEGTLHGFTHTYLGATGIGLVAALSGRPLGEWGLRLLREPQHLPITWRVSFASAFIGSWSHVALDNIMHADLLPFAPFSDARAWYGVIGIDALHMLCIAAAVTGAIAWFLIQRLRGTRG
jgi:membrane-bound metal-dependent hydrolase YbcI (DUF457 family)